MAEPGISMVERGEDREITGKRQQGMRPDREKRKGDEDQPKWTI